MITFNVIGLTNERRRGKRSNSEAPADSRSRESHAAATRISDASRIQTLAGILKEADPEGVPCPLLLSCVTDGRFFSRLGIQTYGFLPMLLAEDFNFTQAVHAADERIPVGALWFGARAIHQPLQRFSL